MIPAARETARVGDRLANSAVLLWATTVFMRLLQIATTTILARLLDPSDYGLVAIAVVITGFLDLLSNIQVGASIIRIQDLDQKHLDTAFTLNLMRGCLSAAVLALIARPAAHFMHDPRLAGVLYVLMIPAILGSLHNPHFILFSRNLDFTKDSKRDALALLCGSAVGIAVAFVLRSYWALVASVVTTSFIFSALSYWKVPGRPRFSLAKSRDMLSFGSWIVLVNILDYMNWRLDYVIIGNKIGPAALGAYNVGSTLTAAATMDIVNSLSKALLPAFSIMSSDMDRLRQRYTEVQSITLALALPIGMGMSALAANIVLLLVGAKWHLAIPVIQFVAPVLALQTLNASIESLAYSLNKGRFIFIRTCFFLLFRSSLMVAGFLLGGFMGIVYARFITGIVNVFYSLFLVTRITGAPALGPLKASWRSLIAAAVMWAALTQLPFPDISHFSAPLMAGWLIVKIAIGAIIYIGLHLLLWHAAGRPEGTETRMLSQGNRVVVKLRRRAA